MDFSWSDEQLAFRDRVVKFAQQELNECLVERDRKSTFSRENWQKCAEFGILGLSVPPEYGGGPDIDILTAMLAMEGMGYGCRDNGLAFALNAQLWTVQLPIYRYGSEDQRKRFLPALCSGRKIGAHAITEPEAGSDIYSLQTRAEAVDDGYVLNGSKRLVTFAPIADLALVFATVNPELGKWGVTAFVVEKDTPGFTASPVREKMGLRTVPIGELYFDDCFVSEANRIGPEGAGVSISGLSLE